VSERDISGYFYGEECEYVYLVTDGSEQNYKFIFKDDKIYAQDGSNSGAEEFIRVVKKITSEFRANGVVKNIDAFAEAFGLQPGDALYLPPEERVRIW